MCGWPVVFVCNSRARPASKDVERVKFSIVPATGLHSESNTVSEGYLQSKDLQRDLFSIFCLPSRSAPKVAFVSGRKAHTVARCFELRSSSPVAPQGLSDVEIIWKSCGLR